MGQPAVAVVALAWLAACGGGPPPFGAERGDCYASGAAERCDPGLECLSELCVRPPPANCAPIADKLASFELGNYAPREQRDKLIADKTAACVAAHVTKDDGDCIARAKDRWDAAKCAPSLFPGMASSGSGDCAEVIARITSAMPASVTGNAQMREQIERTMAVMRTSCAEDAWPDELKQCVLAAPSGQVTGMQACTDKLPKALQDKMTARLMDAMQKGR